MATEEKRYVVETVNRCGCSKFRWSFDILDEANAYLTEYASEKRPGKLYDTETGNVLRIIGR